MSDSGENSTESSEPTESTGGEWTDEEMESAEPYPLPEIPDDEDADDEEE